MAKGDVIAGRDFPQEILNAFRAIGMPEHITSFKIECEGANKPIVFTCTVEARDPGTNAQIIEDDKIKEFSTKYKLVEWKEEDNVG